MYSHACIAPRCTLHICRSGNNNGAAESDVRPADDALPDASSPSLAALGVATMVRKHTCIVLQESDVSVFEQHVAIMQAPGCLHVREYAIAHLIRAHAHMPMSVIVPITEPLCRFAKSVGTRRIFAIVAFALVVLGQASSFVSVVTLFVQWRYAPEAQTIQVLVPAAN